MRVFVEKTKPKEDSKEDGKTGEAIVGKTGAGGIETKEAPKDQGMPKEYEEISRIKVGLYDPDVAGNNISHLKLLPEELAGLNFDEFVKRHRGEVLALHVNDPQLVDYYAGKFVNADRSSQIASLGQAMANNNLVETKRIIERLTGSTGAHDPKGSAIAPSKQPLTKQEANCLIDGLYYALQDGRTKPLKAFLENFTKLADALGLTATQVVSLLEARDERGVPGLHMALNAGQPDAVKEFLEALPSLAKTFELTPNQITSLLEAKDAKGFPGLHMALRHGESDAAIAYLEALLKLKERNLLTDKQITSLLEAKFDGRTILQMADRNGKVKTADDFLASLLNHGFEPTWVNSLRHPTQGKFWRR
jgi:hypothetical protein